METVPTALSEGLWGLVLRGKGGGSGGYPHLSAPGGLYAVEFSCAARQRQKTHLTHRARDMHGSR